MKIKTNRIPPSEPQYIFTIEVGHRELRELQIHLHNLVSKSKMHDHLPAECVVCQLFQAIQNVNINHKHD